MGGESWSFTAKPCDSCKTATAAVFCRAHSAFLCTSCDAEIHAATRHPRVYVCYVCEQSPAVVTCKADAAALCATCDADIHSANPLARRHERLPIVPFYDARSSGEEFSEEEAEAASWLLPDPNGKPDVEQSAEFKFNAAMDPYPDLHLLPRVDEQKEASSDGVVPVEDNNEFGSGQYTVEGFHMEYSGSKPFMYNFTPQSISQSVSSSSFEVGVVPDHNDTSKNILVPCRALGMDREARVLRYKEKRKNRKFNKTIRYASRKAYAETRPRIKGRFAKRDAPYGVVPTF